MNPRIEITNSELFLWSLFVLGGDSSFVDVEDVFLKSFELAPKRLSWRTRADLPDYKKCSKGLRDAEARRPQMLVKTRDGFCRQLSVAGQEWIHANETRLAEMLETGAANQEPKRRPRVQMLTEVERSDAFQTFLSSRVVPVEKWVVAEILRCSPDSEETLWSSRIQALRGAAFAAGKAEVLEFLDKVMANHADWFAGEGR